MVFLLILISLILPPPSMASPYILSRGASLNVEADSDVLISPNKDYTCGFFKVGSNAYTFSIWFSNSANKTKVWSANQDRPVNGHCSRVTMTKDGSLVLTDIGGEVAWSTNTSSTQADRVELLNSGNLVVKDGQGSVLWQSFGSPTDDTLLPTQPITKNSMLVSGYYRFYFDNDNVLKLIYDGPEISSIYWPDPDKDVWNNLRTYYNSTRYGVLDEKGEFIASDRLAFNASDMGIGVLRRLTLDNDGNLRLYSLNNSTGLWSVTWAALSNLCLIHGLCGKNGICLYTESEACCSCPPNFEMADASDWRKGCKRNFNINCDKPDELTFMELPKTDSKTVTSLLFNGYNIRKLVGTTVPSSSERRSDSGQ